jgi:hypothetical protein
MPRSILKLFAAHLCLLALLASPVFAQGPDTPVSSDGSAAEADPEAAELRDWFNALPPERRMQLMNRMRAVRRMPPEERREVIEDRRPVLSERERDNMQRLERMPYLQRVQYNGLSHELNMLRRFDEQGFNEANQLSGEERARAIHHLLQRQRAMHFQRALTPEQRAELEQLQGPERMRRLREMFREAAKERRERLVELVPGLDDLRRRAREGDAEAREEWRRTMSNLLALDFLTMRLQPEARDRVFESARNDGFEAATELARKLLREQWNSDMHRERPQRGPRQGQPQERRGHRGPGAERAPGERGPAERGPRGDRTPPRRDR